MMLSDGSGTSALYAVNSSRWWECSWVWWVQPSKLGVILEWKCQIWIHSVLWRLCKHLYDGNEWNKCCVCLTEIRQNKSPKILRRDNKEVFSLFPFLCLHVDQGAERNKEIFGCTSYSPNISAQIRPGNVLVFESQISPLKIYTPWIDRLK